MLDNYAFACSFSMKLYQGLVLSITEFNLAVLLLSKMQVDRWKRYKLKLR